MYVLEDKITKVIVFNDRAQVMREATISLAKGSFTLVFENIPEDIDAQSVQVTGKGAGTISNVQFNKQYFDNGASQNTYAITQEQRIYEDQLAQQNSAIDRLKKEKLFLDKITDKVTNAGNETTTDLNPRNWQQMLVFYKEKMAEYDEAIFELEKEKTLTSHALNRLKQQFQDMKSRKTKIRYFVEVQVELAKEGAVSLALSYVITQASWTPVYDVRVNSQEKKVSLQYKALVQQSSTENWDNVQLTLSTARPQINGEPPKLSPWRLQVYQPAPPKPAYQTERSKQAKTLASVAMPTGGAMMAAAFSSDESEENYLAQEEILEDKSAIIEAGATAVFFNIHGEHTVKSDNTEHQVNILIHDFEADFQYSTVPKLSPFAYLKVRITNSSTYPLLAGRSNIFLDNNFVANARIENTAPNQEFWASLGIDEGIKVEHKFLKKYEKNSGGMFSKKTTTIIFEYAIEITNYKQTEEKITVQDQLPIAQNQVIKVELVKPHYEPNSEELKKDEYDFLEWSKILKPQEKWEIPLVFSVEYPKEKVILGI